MNDLFMYGYNSHDCHVMMIVFLAIAIRAIKLVHVKVIITCLYHFFNTVSQKVIGHKELDHIRAYMIETLCMLEMCFSPFFIYAITPNDTSRESDTHIGSLYLHSMLSYKR
jgi:hypothetical protein